jgi:hypothetical protein
MRTRRQRRAAAGDPMTPSYRALGRIARSLAVVVHASAGYELSAQP